MLFPKLTHSPPKAAPKQSAPRTSPELWAEHTVKLPQRRPELPSWPRSCRAGPVPAEEPPATAATRSPRSRAALRPTVEAAGTAELSPKLSPAPQPHPRHRTKPSTREKRVCPGQALTCDPPPPPSPRPFRARFYLPGLISRDCPGGPGTPLGWAARPAPRSPPLPVPAGEAPWLAAGYTA